MAARVSISFLKSAGRLEGRILGRRNTTSPHIRQSPPKSLTRSFTLTSCRLDKKFSRDHEWIELSDDGIIGTVGVSAYAAKALGDVVFVELPSVSQTVQPKDQVGAVESVKSASDLYSPVAGEIVETNEAIEKKPSLINSSPEAEGWMFKIKLTDKSDYNGLMTAAEYSKFSEEV